MKISWIWNLQKSRELIRMLICSLDRKQVWCVVMTRMKVKQEQAATSAFFRFYWSEIWKMFNEEISLKNWFVRNRKHLITDCRWHHHIYLIKYIYCTSIHIRYLYFTLYFILTFPNEDVKSHLNLIKLNVSKLMIPDNLWMFLSSSCLWVSWVHAAGPLMRLHIWTLLINNYQLVFRTRRAWDKTFNIIVNHTAETFKHKHLASSCTLPPGTITKPHDCHLSSCGSTSKRWLAPAGCSAVWPQKLSDQKPSRRRRNPPRSLRRNKTTGQSRRDETTGQSRRDETTDQSRRDESIGQSRWDAHLYTECVSHLTCVWRAVQLIQVTWTDSLFGPSASSQLLYVRRSPAHLQTDRGRGTQVKGRGGGCKMKATF